MRRVIRFIWPDRLAVQIAILMFAAIAAFQIIAALTFLFGDPSWRLPIVDPAEAIANALTAVDAADPAQRGAVIVALEKNSPWLRIDVQAQPPAGFAAPDGGGAVSPLARRLWPGASATVPAGSTSPEPREFAVALRKGGYAVTQVLEPRRSASARPSIGQRWLAVPTFAWERAAALFLVTLAVLLAWLFASVISPLLALVRQAERFPSSGEKAPPIVERGPREVRELSRAFNRMQSRIQSMMQSRSRALAAISHDLRTIITRIRLRSEFIADETLKTKMLQDAEIMDSMLYKNLMYLRGEEQEAERSLIDLDSVLQTIADQYSDLGHAVVYEGGEHQTVYGSLTELQRLFSNLVENAVKHGAHTTITAAQPAKGFIAVEIADDGPGIEAAEMARVLEPFVRGEPARTVGAKSGFGLGLSIVKSLAEKDGGRLELVNRKPHGLIARVALPVAFP
ncbi:MAG: HAMP domain-containing protein [Hyphomicrobiales bacterium]|nr:HAMP domain-containing protein [Hyphomicrobiales bacterium]